MKIIKPGDIATELLLEDKQLEITVGSGSALVERMAGNEVIAADRLTNQVQKFGPFNQDFTFRISAVGTECSFVITLDKSAVSGINAGVSSIEGVSGNVSLAQLGLNQVDNTADADKAISDSQAAVNLQKETKIDASGFPSAGLEKTLGINDQDTLQTLVQKLAAYVLVGGAGGSISKSITLATSANLATLQGLEPSTTVDDLLFEWQAGAVLSYTVVPLDKFIDLAAIKAFAYKGTIGSADQSILRFETIAGSFLELNLSRFSLASHDHDGAYATPAQGILADTALQSVNSTDLEELGDIPTPTALYILQRNAANTGYVAIPLPTSAVHVQNLSVLATDDSLSSQGASDILLENIVGITGANIGKLPVNITRAAFDALGSEPAIPVMIEDDFYIDSEYTLATLPSHESGGRIIVSDATGGKKQCWSDGTNWLIDNAGTVVS